MHRPLLTVVLVGFSLVTLCSIVAFTILTALVKPWPKSGNEIRPSGGTTSQASAANSFDINVSSWIEYLNAHGYSFRYPKTVSITSSDNSMPAPPPPPGIADDASYIILADLTTLGGQTVGHGMEVTINDPKSEDAYGDPPSFWLGDLKAIAENVYSRIEQDDGSAVNAPFEQDLGGEQAYWILTKAIPSPQGPEAGVGWNGLGEVSDEDTFIILTSHSSSTYEIIVPDDSLFMQIIGTWQFSFSSVM